MTSATAPNDWITFRSASKSRAQEPDLLPCFLPGQRVRPIRPLTPSIDTGAILRGSDSLVLGLSIVVVRSFTFAGTGSISYYTELSTILQYTIWVIPQWFTPLKSSPTMPIPAIPWPQHALTPACPSHLFGPYGANLGNYTRYLGQITSKTSSYIELRRIPICP